MKFLEIVRGEVDMIAPVKTEPVNVFLDRINVFDVFLHRVSVVESKVAATAIFLGDPEIEADGLGVAKVQVAVRLRGEAGDGAIVFPGREILVDDVTDKVFGR